MIAQSEVEVYLTARQTARNGLVAMTRFLAESGDYSQLEEAIGKYDTDMWRLSRPHFRLGDDARSQESIEDALLNVLDETLDAMTNPPLPVIGLINNWRALETISDSMAFDARYKGTVQEPERLQLRYEWSA
jgi:hypothetical protein